MTSDSPVVLRLTDVSKVFETDEMQTHALSHVNLAIERGEFVSIAGPSGCGKSTLLSILGLLESSTQGTYQIHDFDVSTLSLANLARIRNHEIGFVFQNFNLIGDMTALENVALPLSYRSLSRREKRDLARQSLERVGMLPRENHYPSQLSGGQQQRIAVARAVVGGPAIVLADEPTGNLDSKNGGAVLELLLSLHSDDGATVRRSAWSLTTLATLPWHNEPSVCWTDASPRRKNYSEQHCLHPHRCSRERVVKRLPVYAATCAT